MSGKTLEDSECADNYKNKIAEEHNIKVIRIDSCESNLNYIKSNILNSHLNSLFDLSKVNWNKCEEFALSNLVKIACELKYNNPMLTTVNIGKIMNLHPTTIINYLKRGTNIGWCNYDAKEESRKTGSNISITSCKPVEVFKDNISLGVFESIVDVERKSESLFDIRFSQSCISKVCNGKSKHHKGYFFKYI